MISVRYELRIYSGVKRVRSVLLCPSERYMRRPNIGLKEATHRPCMRIIGGWSDYGEAEVQRIQRFRKSCQRRVATRLTLKISSIRGTFS
jgi:hypothetical protein